MKWNVMIIDNLVEPWSSTESQLLEQTSSQSSAENEHHKHMMEWWTLLEEIQTLKWCCCTQEPSKLYFQDIEGKAPD
jgi:hypothetical protein